jgi:hypothetical protein
MRGFFHDVTIPGLVLRAGFWVAGYYPTFGFVPEALRELTNIAPDTIATGSSALLGLMVTPILAEPFLRLKRPAPKDAAEDFLGTPGRIKLKSNPPRVINVGGMNFDETDMFYNFMCTGSLGSGKTSSILFPAIEQLINLYSVEDEDPLTKNPYAKMGGLSLDVKGEFWEPIALFIHRAGRNVFRDCRIIRAKPFYPVGKFYDPDAKERRYFYLNAMEASSGSSDCGRLLEQIKNPDGSRIRFDLFARSQEEIDEHIEVIRGHTFTINDSKDFRFIGWRQKGNKLVRVHYHNRDGSETFLTDASGKLVTSPIPKRLKFVRVVHVSNNLRWNIVNNRIPSQEAASRLAKIAEMVQKESGSGGGGNENPYFTEAAKRLITNCLEHYKIVYPEDQCEASFIYRMAVNPKSVEEEVKKLDQVIHKVKLKLETLPEDSKKDLIRLLMRAEAVREYFGSEWKELDQKTKTITASVVSNMTQPFMGDAYLRESFCSAETYSFEEAIQYGRFFCFVPGGDYENMGKIIGTAQKIDFQSIALKRIQASFMGKARRQGIFIDEYQRYAIAGGSSIGDDNFTALARQAKCIFFAATQSYAWFESTLGKDPTRALLQSFTNRIFLQNMDLETNKLASELCGTLEKESTGREENDISMINMLDPQNPGRFSVGRNDDRKPRYRPDDFQNLNMLESITFNKGERNSYDKVVRKLNKWHWIGGPEGERQKKHFLHWYFQGEIESCLENVGKFDFLDPEKPDSGEGEQGIPKWATEYHPTPIPEAFDAGPKAEQGKSIDSVREKIEDEELKETETSASQQKPPSPAVKAPEAPTEDAAFGEATQKDPKKVMNSGVRGTRTTVVIDSAHLRTMDVQARRTLSDAPKKTFRTSQGTGGESDAFEQKPKPSTPVDSNAKGISRNEMEEFLGREFQMARLISKMGDVFGRSDDGDPISVTMDLAMAGQRDQENGALKSSVGREGKVSILQTHQNKINPPLRTPRLNEPDAASDIASKRFQVIKTSSNTPEKDKEIQEKLEQGPPLSDSEANALFE